METNDSRKSDNKEEDLLDSEIDELKETNFSMVSFGMGDFLFEVFNGVYAAFFFLFWETEVGLNVFIVALAYTIYAIWNAINDPLVGYLADRPNKYWKKYGKRFPYVMIAGIPAILILAAIFSPPYLDPISGAWIYFAWILISACSYEFFFTVLSLNHFALYPDKFRLDADRRKAGGVRMALSLVGTAVGFIIPPLFVTYGDRQSYMTMAWSFVIINVIIFATIIPGHRESNTLKQRYVSEASKEKESFLKTLKLVLTQKNFIVVMLVLFMDSIIGASLTASIHYITKYLLEGEAGLSTFLLAGFLLGALGSIFPWLIIAQKWKNNRNMLILGVFLNTIFLLPFMFAQGLLGMVLCTIFLGIGGGALRIGRNPVLADVIDEATVRNKRHTEGAFMGVYTFFLRLSLIAQGWIFAIVHTLTGFDAHLTTQTDLAKLGIRMHTALIPMILTLIGFVIFVLVYDLRPEKTQKIKQQLKELNL